MTDTSTANVETNEIKFFVRNAIISHEKILYKSYGNDVLNKREQLTSIAIADYLNKVYNIFYQQQTHVHANNFPELQKLFELVESNDIDVNKKHNIICLLEIIMNLIVSVHKFINNKLLCIENINLYIHSVELQVDKILSTTDVLLYNLLNHKCKPIALVDMNIFDIYSIKH